MTIQKILTLTKAAYIFNSANRFRVGLIFLLFLSPSVFGQNVCTKEQKERVVSLVGRLEENDFTRIRVEKSELGDCVRLLWMDEMKKFGVRKVSAKILFTWKAGLRKSTVTELAYYDDYFAWNLIKKSQLKTINKSSLPVAIKQALNSRAERLLNAIFETNTKFQLKTRKGTVRLYLLEDEAIPVISTASDTILY